MFPAGDFTYLLVTPESVPCKNHAASPGFRKLIPNLCELAIDDDHGYCRIQKP